MLPINNIDNSGSGGGPGSGGIGGGSEVSFIAGKDLRDGTNASLRPTALTSRHLYNLRNQSWAIPKATFGGGVATVDLISQFHTIGSSYPSNTDLTEPFVYPNTAIDPGDKYIGRFNAQDCSNNAAGSSSAPIGYFVIDVLDRGASRRSAYAQMMAQYPTNSINIEDLPVDESPAGPTAVAEYSGRIFYTGFSGEVLGPDSSSPKLSSYVLFSQTVTDFSSIYSCYQAGDPTSSTDSALVDTDGGFIRVDGAYNIVGLANIQSGLVVLAENGVWVIKGGGDGGFTGTNYKVIKVTNSGCISAGSIVIVNNAVLYFSKDGIFNVSTNQYGDYVADSVTQKTIRRYYSKIPQEDLASAVGVYDSYEHKVKWVYGNRMSSELPVVELCLDLVIGAFTKHTIQPLDGIRFPLLFGGIQTVPYINSGEPSYKEVLYLVLTGTSGTVSFTFADYLNPDHIDWKSVDGKGIDAKSFLLTGALCGGDTQRGKTINYLTAHFTKTEDGLVDDGSGGLTLRNPSSCMLQAQWNWTDNANSNKWSSKKQAYRFRRAYYPTSPDNFDNGHYVVETKSKIRGDGKAVSFLFESEPGKHLTMLGWALSVGTDGNV